MRQDSQNEELKKPRGDIDDMIFGNAKPIPSDR